MQSAVTTSPIETTSPYADSGFCYPSIYSPPFVYDCPDCYLPSKHSCSGEEQCCVGPDVRTNYYQQQVLRRRGSPNAGGSYDRPLARQSGQAYVPAYSELQYKKPKKKFNSKEEKMEYVRSYMAKEKTELCKNWQAYGRCKFGNHCSFAHGVEELRVRTDVNSTFKTRQCKQYAENMICSYGSRCQFIHTPMTVEKQREVSYARMLHDNEGYVEARINCMGNWHPENSEYLTYISAYERRRLSVFAKLAESPAAAPKS